MNFPVNITVPYVDNLEQRGYADMIEKLVAEEAKKHNPKEFRAASSKRSIEDFSYHTYGKYVWYDVKSFDAGSDFSMPNLVSIDRLRKVIKSKMEELVYIFVEYTVDHTNRKVDIQKIEFRPVYTIDPSVLAIQNLGKGVLQIKNMHNSVTTYTGTKEEWMKEISVMAHNFYAKQIAKFMKLQLTWQ
jgi:uncharacterized protein YoxC